MDVLGTPTAAQVYLMLRLANIWLTNHLLPALDRIRGHPINIAHLEYAGLTKVILETLFKEYSYSSCG